MSSTHIALLRGINVGGKNKVPMKELAASFTEAGCTDVRTYIQSGNVIFRASEKNARRFARIVSERWGVPIVLRTAAELNSIVANNPFVAAGCAENLLHVLFLAEAIPDGVAAALDPLRFAPDEFIVRGREIYFHLPNGVAQSRIFRESFDLKLRTVCTMRNWRTTKKLLELASAAG